MLSLLYASLTPQNIYLNEYMNDYGLITDCNQFRITQCFCFLTLLFQSIWQQAKLCPFEEGKLCEWKSCKSDTTVLFICKYVCAETEILYIHAEV